MKINSLKSIVGAGVALATIAGVWSPFHLQATEQVKGATKLLSARIASAPETSTFATKTDMTCPKCITVAVQNVNVQKGHIRTVTAGETHLCDGCSTKVVTQGTGKAAKTVAQHSCAMGGDSLAGCCGK